MDSKQDHACTACHVTFSDPSMQRDHYKTDWHRYNLKRKVAEMPPVSKDAFEQKMSTHETQRKMMSGEIKEPTGYCAPCRKNFNTQSAYQNHLGSKKHRETAAQFEQKEGKETIESNRVNRKPSESTDAEFEIVDGDDDMEVEEVDSDEWDDGGDPIPVTECVFCGHHSKDLEKNLIHMNEKHCFFLPDAEYCVDLEGMMEYLGKKVGSGFMCLYCNEKSKLYLTLAAVQKHMLDKAHCKIRHEQDALIEYSRFYDFSTSYPEGGDGGDGDGRDQPVDLDRLDDTGYELVLPSGAKVGHRSLMRYYRQSLNPDRQVQARGSMNRVLHHYKALGWTGMTALEAKKKHKDIKYMHRVQQKHYMRLGVKANKFQTYWRDPTGMIG